MSFIENAERVVRSLGRDIVTPPQKRQLWFWYMEAKRQLITQSRDLPAIVLIEVNTDCNRGCWYCPNKDFPKERQLMDEDVFKKVIAGLEEVDYRGRIALHQSSEPLLHPNLEGLMAYADSRLPRAELAVYTNGDFLDRERFDRLNEAGVDTWIITQHGTNIPKPLQELIANLTPEESEKVTFQTIWQNKLYNRTVPGLIPETQRIIPNPCFTASFHLQVLVDGNVPQCSMGFKGEHVFGNVRDRGLLDIWRDPEFARFRHEVGHGQFKLGVCQSCVNDTPTPPQEQLIQVTGLRADKK